MAEIGWKGVMIPELIYWAGRIFQLIGLIALPSAIWVGHFGHNERGSIAIFAASFVVFYLGYGLIKISKKMEGHNSLRP